MQVRVATFWVPKAGNHLDEYEDAFYPTRNGCHVGEQISFAVADGASEGMLSDAWARLLVKAFVRHGASGSGDWLERSFSSWGTWQRHYLESRNRQGRPLQWFEEPGWRAGAFASLLGLSLFSDGWRATAVGDSCLFQLREDRVEHTFPLSSRADFGGRPVLLCSRPEKNRGTSMQTARGSLQAWDRFYLMTDALACYLLAAVEEGEAPSHVIGRLEEDFPRRVDDLRKAALLKNDDVTMVGIEILQECDQR